ncbi:MAG: HAMP domain-containing protein [Candidatus Omnitrophica bacterium]|nr:HAMP domain-containing protein [Candidatus Omnitrophota bacterium]
MRMSIRKKLAILILTAILLTTGTGIGLGYFFGFRLLRNTIAMDYVKMSDLLSEHMSLKINDLVKEMTVYLSAPQMIRQIKETNRQYTDGDSTDKMFAYMDKQWQLVPEDDTFFQRYISSETGTELKVITQKDPELEEVLLTDRKGGLVASSGITSDFYQGDETWWQKAFSGGEGKVFIEGITYDESVGKLALSIAIPLKEGKELLGVAKVVVNSKRFLEPLERFHIGKTGHAVLTDDEGVIIYHIGMEPFENRILDEKAFRKFVSTPQKWAVIRSPHIHERDMLLAFSRIDNSYLEQSGLGLIILIDKETREAYMPLRKLILQMFLVTGMLILFWIPLGLLFGNFLVKPLRKLHEATEHVQRGEMDYPIHVRTGDEIEQLASSFKYMVSRIRARESELKDVNESLEQKIEDRTHELKRSQQKLQQKNKELEEKVKELEQTQKMLVQTEKLSSLGKLIGEMAHEVNNPLQAIYGRAQLSLMEEIESDQLKKNFKIIEEQCSRAKDIIRRLLDFSKPSKGETTQINITDVMEDTLKLIEHQYSLENVNIKKNYSSEDLQVEVDKNQIEEVFFNIVKNSSEAMDRGGDIAVTTTKEGDMARVEIRDTGPGMSDDELEKIFDPFYTTKEKGTGLGLSICFGIVKDHGGNLKYESEPGKGTTATVFLPLKGKSHEENTSG